MADITNLEWIQQHNAELSNILKTIKTPAVNGITETIRATANLSMGDFVQLTDYGIEIPTFEELASWEQGTSGRNGVSVAVLAHNKIVWTYIQYTGTFTSSSEKKLYVQGAMYENGAWIVSEPLLLHTVTTTYCDVNIMRRSESRAVICFGADTPKKASVFVVNSRQSAAKGFFFEADITQIDVIDTQRTRYTPIKIVPAGKVNEYVIFLPRNNSTYSGLTAVLCTDYTLIPVGSSFKILSTADVYTGSSTEDGKTFICQLNSNSILISSTKGGALSYNSSVAHLQVVTVNEDNTITVTAPTLKGYPGPIVQIADNLVVHCPMYYNKTCEYLQYDPESGTFTATDIVNMPASTYAFDMVRISDNKLAALVGTDTAPNPYMLAIIDLEEGAVTVHETTIDGTGHVSGVAVRRLSSNYGVDNEGWFEDDNLDWVGIVNGVTGILVTPASIMHTAGPYVDTIGGVALADGVQGKKMPVVVPG